jgi:UDP-GlcNAc:undecaprenyl-phosphate GlcNAc-1-phosphate transferase
MAVSGMPAGGTYAAISTILMTYACWQVWKRIRANEARSLKEQSSKLNDQVNDQ